MGINRKTVFINLFNIENNATKEDISNFYEGLRILNIIQNAGKQGNYDLLFESKTEAVKLIDKGAGVNCYKVFFIYNEKFRKSITGCSS